MFGGAGGEDELVDVAVDVERDQGLEHLGGGGLEQHVAVVGRLGGRAAIGLGGGEEFAEAGEGQHRADLRLLDEGVFEARVDDLDGVDLTVEIGLHHQFDDGLYLGESKTVGDGEVGDEVALGAGEELAAFAADGVELGRGLHLDDELEEVGVEGAAEAFVGGEKQDAAGLDLALGEEGVLHLGEAGGEAGEHPGEQLGVGAAGEGGLLRLLHLRRRHQLHRLGDLAGVFDGLDPAADIAGGGHEGESRI